MKEHDEAKLVAAAAAKAGSEPDALLDFRVYADKVAIVLPNGQKFVYHYADLVGFFSEPAKPAKARRSRANTRK